MSDWGYLGRPQVAAVANLTIVLHTAEYTVDADYGPSSSPYRFQGFRYHFEYASEDVPAYWLLECGSWELDGDIAGATVFSQSMCADPRVNGPPKPYKLRAGRNNWKS